MDDQMEAKAPDASLYKYGARRRHRPARRNISYLISIITLYSSVIPLPLSRALSDSDIFIYRFISLCYS